MAETTNKEEEEEEEEDTGLEMCQMRLEPWYVFFFFHLLISLLTTIYRLTMGRTTSTTLPLSTPPPTNTYKWYPGAPKRAKETCLQRVSWARGSKRVCKHVCRHNHHLNMSKPQPNRGRWQGQRTRGGRGRRGRTMTTMTMTSPRYVFFPPSF